MTGRGFVFGLAWSNGLTSESTLNARIQGDEARDRRDWPKAVEHYRGYLKAKPGNFAIWVQLGHALKEAGRPIEALAAYSEALRLDGRDADLLLNLGHLHRRMGHMSDAVDYYRRSAELDGNLHAVAELRALGESLAANGTAPPPTLERHGGGMDFYKVLGGFDPARKIMRAANAARDRRDWAEAAALYRDYLAQRPLRFAIWVQLGHALKEAGQMNEALAAYNAALKLDGDDADLLLNMGRLFAQMGDRATAVSYYRRAEKSGEAGALDELRKLHVPISEPHPISSVTRGAQQQRAQTGINARDALDSLSTTPDPKRPWFYLDVAYYLQQCAAIGLAAPGRQSALIIRHFKDNGGPLRLSPNRFFNESFYQDRHPGIDLGQGQFGSGFAHFAAFGAASGLSPAWFFKDAFYRNQYGEQWQAETAGRPALDAYSHFLLAGLPNGLAGSILPFYLSHFRLSTGGPTSAHDLAAMLGDPARLEAWLNPLFEAEWYAAKYGTGGDVGENISQYFSTFRRRSPSPAFDETYYRESYPDVSKAADEGRYASAYEHFLEHGMFEGRHPFPGFDVDYYLEANENAARECENLKLPAYLHFLKFRRQRSLVIARPFSDRVVPEPFGKAIFERRSHVIAATSTRQLNEEADPVVSIILIARNKFADTYQCIQSIITGTTVPHEIILYDNASTDEIAEIPAMLPNIRYIRAPQNKGFTVPVNEAAEIARGSFLIIGNNDTEITPQAVDKLVAAMENDSSIGLIGGRIIRTHGMLQEGGSIIWSDGTCLGYGRDLDPFDGRVSFQRDVDYCSGCFLGIRTEDWRALGGFDPAYAPAYYEETDLSVRVWQMGKRVVYDPAITIWHYEFGSSTLPEDAIALMRRNQARFATTHQAFLSQCLPPAVENIELARLRHAQHPRVLFIEDHIPDARIGMGFVRSAQVAKVLEIQCGHLTVVGMHPAPIKKRQWDRGDWAATTEVLTDVNHTNLLELLANRKGFYDCIWLSRTHNIEKLAACRAQRPDLFSGLRIVVDTEAIAALRTCHRARLFGETADQQGLIDAELFGLEIASDICVVNTIDLEAVQQFAKRKNFAPRLHVVGHALETIKEPKGFEAREGIFLTGSFSNPLSPNVDAVRWFDAEIRPRLSASLANAPIFIAGHKARDFVDHADLRSAYSVMNDVADMAELYSSARLIVAPTRFAGGIPYKVHEAAAHGVPVVMTELLGHQIGWTDDSALGVVRASTPEGFAAMIERFYTDAEAWRRCQASQLNHMAVEGSHDRFTSAIRKALPHQETKAS